MITGYEYSPGRLDRSLRCNGGSNSSDHDLIIMALKLALSKPKLNEIPVGLRISSSLDTYLVLYRGRAHLKGRPNFGLTMCCRILRCMCTLANGPIRDSRTNIDLIILPTTRTQI